MQIVFFGIMCAASVVSNVACEMGAKCKQVPIVRRTQGRAMGKRERDASEARRDEGRGCCV
jgi:hypothetical protein